jgi:hypothetical protein
VRNAEPAETYVVENLALDRDVAKITFRSGTISFAAPLLDRVWLGIFAGEATFELASPTANERAYLKARGGEESVKEQFTEAVFVFTDASYKELKANGKPMPPDPKAAGILRDLRKKLRRRTDDTRSMLESLLMDESIENVEAEVLRDLYNPATAGAFNAYIKGKRHGDMRFFVRPRGALPQLPSPEEVALLNINPTGTDDGIWYHSHLKQELDKQTGDSGENKRVVRALHYRIDTAIAGNERLKGQCEISFQAESNGERVIHFDLLPSLRVSSVKDPARDIPFIQEDRKQDAGFYVIFPEPLVKSKEYRLTIDYEGDKVVRDAGGGNFAVGARTSWYPSVNSFLDRAKYDLTFRVPKAYTLVAVGKLAKQSREGNMTVSEWSSETPLAVAGFNYGQFKKKQVSDGPTAYQIEGYATTELPDSLKLSSQEVGGMVPTRLLDTALSQSQNSLRIFTQWFGKAPYGRIAITQQPQFSFGQSWPTLVYLPLFAFLDSTQRTMLLGGIKHGLTTFVEEVTPHEVSHQWWGHLVGWATYRDQWLSGRLRDILDGSLPTDSRAEA